MKFIPAKCPSCGGELQIPDQRDFVKCMYCGVDIKVRDVIEIRTKINVENLIELGNLAIETNQFSKANEYFEKVLENEIENYDAWIGKGIVCLHNEEYKGAEEYFHRSLNYVPNEKQTEYKELLANKFITFGCSFSLRFFEKIIDELVIEEPDNYYWKLIKKEKS
jgi:tetratricopeptide (TPR) repeat protein